MEEKRQELFENLKKASPLDIADKLIDLEMYDQRMSSDIIDEVYEQFQNSEAKVENIIIPVFTSITDGFFKKSKIGKSLQKKGLTCTRIIQECNSFSYDNTTSSISEVYSEVEKNGAIRNHVNNQENINNDISKDVNQEYSRNKKIDDDTYYNYGYTSSEREKEFNDKFGKKNKTMKDEYSDERIYRSSKQKDNRMNDPKYKQRAELDHIIPLEKVHEQLKQSCLLDNDDVKKIANQNSNYAVTSNKINNKKRSDNNDEFINSVKADEINLSDESKKRMMDKQKNAQKELDKTANKNVANKLKDGHKKNELKSAAKIKTEEAAKAAGDIAVGTILIEVMKPVFYEIKDSLINGVSESVGKDSLGEAMAFRMNRVKTYIHESLAGTGMSSVTDLVKMIVSSLIQAIIDLFFGIIKQMLRLLKEGVVLVISAIKILSDNERTNAEKGDAVVKLVGSVVVGVLGNMLIEKLNLPEPWETIVESLVTGCGVLMFMTLMDKVDIFSAKAEKRKMRIQEIFEERIQDIHEAVEKCNLEVVDTLKKQREAFENVNELISKGIDENNIDDINKGLYDMAKFMDIKLEYSNTDEFLDFMETEELLEF